MTRSEVRLRLLVAVLACVAGSAAALAQTQTPLASARARYAAADYEGALAALADARRQEDEDALEADRLQAFCLLALDRAQEADAVIARIVTSDPSFDPGDEASPRIRIAFRTVREKLVPMLARRLYDEGRAAFDRGAFVDAVQRFTEALPAIEALAGDGDRLMEERRVLTNGFLALARERVPPAAPTATPLVGRGWTVETLRPPIAGSAGAAPAPSQPVPIRQDLPPWTPGLGGPDGVFRGAIDVRIDERGRVVEARVVAPVHPLYDETLLRAAWLWRYQPARRAGLAVASHKRVEVVLRAR